MNGNRSMNGIGAEFGRHGPEDPFPLYERLRAADAVPWSDYYQRWVVLGYEPARQVLLDDSFHTEDAFRHMMPRLAEGGARDLGDLQRLFRCTPFFIDSPAHGPARRFLAKVLAHRSTAELRNMTEALAARLVATARARGGFDLVQDYASLIPAGVIAFILGMPEEDVPEIGRAASAVVELFDIIVPLRTYRRADDAARRMIDYFADIIRARRRTPRDDGISLMLRLAREEPGYTDRDIAAFCAFTFLAGEETTGSFISGGAAALFENPDLVVALRANPGRIPRAADDILRHQSPVQAIGRLATQERLIGGKTIAPGDHVAIFLAAANRDPSVYPGGGCPVMEREGPSHLAFGWGTHSCLGAALARMEGSAAFAKLLALPAPRFDAAHAVWARRRLFRGLASLPVEL